MDNMETKYTDIIIYACGFLALIMAIVIVVLCRMQVHPSREPFDALPVQKLSKFPLRRQVQHSLDHLQLVVQFKALHNTSCITVEANKCSLIILFP